MTKSKFGLVGRVSFASSSNGLWPDVICFFAQQPASRLFRLRSMQGPALLRGSRRGKDKDHKDIPIGSVITIVGLLGLLIACHFGPLIRFDARP